MTDTASRTGGTREGAVNALLQATSTAEAVDELLRAVCRGLGCQVGLFWCADPGDDTLHLDGAWFDPSTDAREFVRAMRHVQLRRAEDLPGAVWASGEPAWVPDLATDDRFTRRGPARGANLRSALAVPVPVGDARGGVIECLADRELAADPPVLESLAAVAGYLGTFLQRRATATGLHTNEAWLQALDGMDTDDRLRFQARLLDAVGEAVLATDLDGRILYWNAFAERMYGWKAGEVLGRDVTEVTPSIMSREQSREIMDRLKTGQPWTGEFMVRDRTGREFSVLVNDSPIFDEDGRLIGIIGTSTEITDRKRREEGQRFLAEAGRVLASSLDYETTLRSVASLAVPYLGDWCLVHIRDADVHLVAPVARVVPGEHADSAEALDRMLTRDSDLAVAVLSRETALVGPSPDGPAGLREEQLREMGVEAALAVPLRARGGAVGVMTFARVRAGERYEETEVAVAEELGRRAGLAIDNARLYREAEEGNRAKADFLAVVSHELRTPLNAIAGYADLLAGGIAGDLNDRQQRHVERIKVGAGHLAHIIDEILAYARVETGRERVRLEPADAGRVAREAAIVVATDAAHKGLELETEIPEQGPELVTDPGKVRQILVNLLNNAVKYTETGSVTLAVTPVERGVVFEVRDTGIGIAPEDQERIFEPFWQAESPNTRTVGGTGLGLSVSRRLAHLLDGEVGLTSAVGDGSTFTVRIPDLSHAAPAGE